MASVSPATLVIATDASEHLYDYGRILHTWGIRTTPLLFDAQLPMRVRPHDPGVIVLDCVKGAVAVQLPILDALRSARRLAACPIIAMHDDHQLDVAIARRGYAALAVCRRPVTVTTFGAALARFLPLSVDRGERRSRRFFAQSVDD